MGHLEEQLNNQKARLKFLEKERDRLFYLDRSRKTTGIPEKNNSDTHSIEKIDKKINEAYSELSVIKIRRLMTLL
ncbi:MAG: hypothetical protein KAT40_04550 [Bacteroidales bacterium]|nr:hypothetical protein [Bacteroidales bacterium]